MIENSPYTTPREYTPRPLNHFTMTRPADKKRNAHRDNLDIAVITDKPVTQEYVNALATFITRIEAAPIPREPFSYYSKVAL